ncbi:MAG TPA: pilin [Syntrophorhabdaceae bacterium]|nr:pilin [Syntrophorhabdaceae bacterium]
MLSFKKNKGFTLIELLIVIAIIGILAAIAIPAYSNYAKKSRLTSVINSMGAVKNAIIAYYTENTSTTFPACSDAAAIKTTFGVEPQTQYATYTTDANAVITATSTISGLTGTLTLTPDWSTGRWTWGGTVDNSYIPKN